MAEPKIDDCRVLCGEKKENWIWGGYARDGSVGEDITANVMTIADVSGSLSSDVSDIPVLEVRVVKLYSER